MRKQGKRNSYRQKKAGKPPGTLEYTGEQHVEIATCQSMIFNAGTISEKVQRGTFVHQPAADHHQWYDIVGLHDVELIRKIGHQFNLHPLVLEDLLSVSQRAKVEVHQNYIFVVLRMIQPDPETGLPQSEQVSLILGDSWLLTFQERKGDPFEVIRERIRNGRGQIRKSGLDYLAYALIDVIVDQYFIVLEHLGDRVETLEASLFAEHSSQHLVELQGMKREIIALRKSIWPLREAINNLVKSPIDLISQETTLYFRDTYDHTIQIIDTIESLRDIVGGVQDLYLSVVNNKMNEVMKVLALISTIFLPLSLLAGIYGMNFDHMPELHVKWGYPILILLMLGLGLGMYLFFKRKKWI